MPSRDLERAPNALRQRDARTPGLSTQVRWPRWGAPRARVAAMVIHPMRAYLRGVTGFHCACGHFWSEHRSPRLADSFVGVCEIAGCRCAMPESERLRISDLGPMDRLECLLAHTARTPATAQAVSVDAGSRWEPYWIGGERVILIALGGCSTIAATEPELHFYFRRLGVELPAGPDGSAHDLAHADA